MKSGAVSISTMLTASLRHICCIFSPRKYVVPTDLASLVCHITKPYLINVFHEVTPSVNHTSTVWLLNIYNVKYATKVTLVGSNNQYFRCRHSGNAYLYEALAVHLSLQYLESRDMLRFGLTFVTYLQISATVGRNCR